MADVKKSVEFTLRAKTAPLEASLKKIPEVTDKEAKKAPEEVKPIIANPNLLKVN